MLENASNRELLQKWQAGSEAASAVLVRRFMTRLTALARARLAKTLARRIDAEDVVMSAWRSFFVAAGRNQIHVPEDDNLWPLLVTVTLRKLARQAARHTSARRSTAKECGHSDKLTWPAIAARDPTPDEAAQVADDIAQLMRHLSATDRDILTRRLQGDDLSEIATAAGCSTRTVRRALHRVRQTFQTLHDITDVEVNGLFSTRASEADDAGRDSDNATRQASTEEPLSSPCFDYSDIVLERLVGQGAFGRVYQARFTSDGQPVAVKFLRKEFWRDPQAAGHLLHEVEAVAPLSHPGIVRHFGWGKTQHSAVFAVMEWIDGDDLAAWRRTVPPSVTEAVECGRAVCEAVAAAHQAGIVHGDLTPRNVLRRKDGRFVLTDFGFCRSLGNHGVSLSAGTPGFLAPEQLCDVFGSVSARTDVYGIGGLLYFLLTGRPPVAASSVAVSIAATLSLASVQSVGQIVDRVPRELDELISDCLAKEPQKRPESVSVVRDRLEQL